MHNLTIAELVKGLQSKEFTSVELTQHFLDRIASLDPAYNAVITVTAEQALKAAAAADQVGHGRLTHRHHGTGVREHDQEHQAQTKRAKFHEQQTCTDQRHAGTVSKQLDALACMVTQPTPNIGRQDARQGLNSREQANRGDRKPQGLEPQR